MIMTTQEIRREARHYGYTVVGLARDAEISRSTAHKILKGEISKCVLSEELLTKMTMFFEHKGATT